MGTEFRLGRWKILEGTVVTAAHSVTAPDATGLCVPSPWWRWSISRYVYFITVKTLPHTGERHKSQASRTEELRGLRRKAPNSPQTPPTIEAVADKLDFSEIQTSKGLHHQRKTGGRRCLQSCEAKAGWSAQLKNLRVDQEREARKEWGRGPGTCRPDVQVQKAQSSLQKAGWAKETRRVCQRGGRGQLQATPRADHPPHTHTPRSYFQAGSRCQTSQPAGSRRPQGPRRQIRS